MDGERDLRRVLHQYAAQEGNLTLVGTVGAGGDGVDDHDAGIGIEALDGGHIARQLVGAELVVEQHRDVDHRGGCTDFPVVPVVVFARACIVAVDVHPLHAGEGVGEETGVLRESPSGGGPGNGHVAQAAVCVADVGGD